MLHLPQHTGQFDAGLRGEFDDATDFLEVHSEGRLGVGWDTAARRGTLVPERLGGGGKERQAGTRRRQDLKFGISDFKMGFRNAAE